MSEVREAIIEYRGRTRGSKLTSSHDVGLWAQETIGYRVAESFLVLALNSRNEVVSYCEVGRGAIHSCPVEPCEVFRYLLLAGVSRAILVHNHPNGDLGPSNEDVALTARLVEAGKILGVTVLDHVVVTSDSHWSFKDHGLL